MTNQIRRMSTGIGGTVANVYKYCRLAGLAGLAPCFEGKWSCGQGNLLVCHTQSGQTNFKREQKMS